MIPENGDLYLASQSPRRRELLQQLGVRFSVVDVDVPEVKQHNESASDYVQRLAISKAQAGLYLSEGKEDKEGKENKKEQSNKPVLGADTIVVLGERVFEKPVDQDDAVAMLMALSDNTHRVMTAVALTSGTEASERGTSGTEATETDCHCYLSVTEVSFRAITQREAQAYYQTGEPTDKAGGYGIQGFGAAFVKRINGSYSGVVGLPLAETASLLTAHGIPIWQSPAAVNQN